MAKKYCKKSSLTSVADEVRTRNGTSAQIPFANIATTIENLAIPTQRGAPSTVLTASNPSTTLQKGKYTGGSVSVVPQNATATLTQNGGYVSIESGKTLASVTVPAKSVVSVDFGTKTFSSGQTEVNFQTSFAPVGYMLVLNYGSTYPSSSESNGRIASIVQFKNGAVFGNVASPSSSYTFCPIVSTSTVFSDSGVSIKGLVASDNGTNYSASFMGYRYFYIVWG